MAGMGVEGPTPDRVLLVVLVSSDVAADRHGAFEYPARRAGDIHFRNVRLGFDHGITLGLLENYLLLYGLVQDLLRKP